MKSRDNKTASIDTTFTSAVDNCSMPIFIGLLEEQLKLGFEFSAFENDSNQTMQTLVYKGVITYEFT